MTHWMMVFMVGLLTLTIVPPRHTEMNALSTQTTEAQAQAVATVSYINQINDTLYTHPQNDGVVDIAKPAFPLGPVNNLRTQGKTWVYQPDYPGLMNALINASLSSSLVGRVYNRQLFDHAGLSTGLMAPTSIPDGSIVYIN
ncbi:type IV pilus biogenesis protein PilM [Yersinia mollaretii]|uniref:type IV pilus biogenesis protein PilM n=1 Tax=Yersinia mollaretii TaxID=33060 RepID=UPI0011A2BBC8|nr:type IV pilus biogenesis protein PilM [Yersinia mollaretii]